MIRSSLHNRTLSAHVYLVVAIGLGFLLSSYVLLRYSGLWGEVDTNAFSRFIISITNSGELIPPGGTYPNGYGYQALGVFLTQVSGTTPSFVQLYSSVLLAVWIVLPAWLLYREFTGSAKGATSGAILLLVQPELLFVLARGSHEKFTRGLMLLSLYLLVRSLRSADRPTRFAGFVGCFYLATYGVISFNSFLANSFILAIIFALILCWFIMREQRLSFRPSASVVNVLQRLMLVGSVCLLLSFSFIFYIYTPAQHSLQFLGSIGEQAATLVLDVEETERFNPYETITTAWVSTEVYLMLTLSNWLLLGISATIWLWQTVAWIIRRQIPQDIGALLLWSFYGAFALQGALSILADVSGSVGNLQHRVFPSFTLLAVPVIAKVLAEWKPQNIYVKRVAYGVISVAIGVLAILSTLKATNEPLLSNKWLFHQSSEIHAIDWANTYLEERWLWVGIDERLTTAYSIQSNRQMQDVTLDAWDIAPNTRTFLLSDIIRSRTARLEVPLPIKADSFVTYDNGQAQIYRLRPETPYQR